jgi:hypothetical protein
MLTQLKPSPSVLTAQTASSPCVQNQAPRYIVLEGNCLFDSELELVKDRNRKVDSNEKINMLFFIK